MSRENKNAPVCETGAQRDVAKDAGVTASAFKYRPLYVAVKAALDGTPAMRFENYAQDPQRLHRERDAFWNSVGEWADSFKPNPTRAEADAFVKKTSVLSAWARRLGIFVRGMAKPNPFKAELAKSGITPKNAKAHGLKYLLDASAHHRSLKPVPAILIPYRNAAGKLIKDYWRVRYLPPPPGFHKYSQAPDTPPRLYYPLPPDDVSWEERQNDPKYRLIFPEGEKKAIKAAQEGLPGIGLGGVWNFKSKKRGLPFLPELDAIDWQNREVDIVYDSDMRTNPNVGRAADAFAVLVTQRGAVVRQVVIEDKGSEKQGLDDFLVNEGGAEAYYKLAKDAPIFSRSKELHRLNTEVAYMHKEGVIVELKSGRTIRPYDFKEHQYSDRKYYYLAGKNRNIEKDNNAAAEWLKWGGRHKLRCFTFDPALPPGPTPDLEYNLWRGFAVEEKQGDVGPWLDLLGFLVSDRTERAHALRWFAHVVQHPELRLIHALLLWSKLTGTGKSALGEPFIDIFGRDKGGREITERDLTSDFDGWWKEGSVFILGNEITGNHPMARKEIMKNNISDNMLNISKKNVSQYSVPNRCNYFLTSNSSAAIKLDGDTDRRYYVIHVPEERKSPEYFKRYFTWAKSKEGQAALLYYLRRVKLKGFDPTAPAPITAAKKAMVLAGEDHVSGWRRRLYADPNAVLKTPKSDLLQSSQIFAFYQSDNPGDRKTTLRQFEMELGLPHMRIERNVPKAERKRLGQKNVKLTVYAVRNGGIWKDQPMTAWRSHYEQHYGLLVGKGPGGREKA